MSPTEPAQSEPSIHPTRRVCPRVSRSDRVGSTRFCTVDGLRDRKRCEFLLIGGDSRTIGGFGDGEPRHEFRLQGLVSWRDVSTAGQEPDLPFASQNDGSDISEPLVDAIKTALDVGFTHVDAAEVYGTDPEIALAIKGRDRGSLYITNKIFPGLGDIPGSAKKMVERMGPVDLYLVHAPFFDSVGQPNLKIADAWAAMEQTVADGITKSIGVSNFSVPHLEELLKSAKIKVC